MTVDDIIREIRNFEESEFFGPANEETVRTASSQIGLPFSKEYMQFLSTLGAGHVNSESFIGLGGPLHLDVVFLTETLRKKKGLKQFANELIPIRSDGFGNYDCIDTAAPLDSGEFAIVEWVHDASSDQTNRVLANGYFDWFMEILELLRKSD